MCFVTTLFLQILSNLANDYGDSEKGTDNEDRIGPMRAVQSGQISLSEMKRAVIIFSALSFISGIVTTLLSFEIEELPLIFLFITLGLTAVAAAIKYTVGKSAYGYRGLGDLFVFLFFGLLGVCGTYYLQEKVINWEIFLPASGIGLLSVGVLNLNNMRDRESDQKAGKITLAVHLGEIGAKRYHSFLILTAILCFVSFTYLSGMQNWAWLWLLAVPLLLKNLITAVKETEPAKLDPLLKQLALSTALLVLCFGIGGLISL